MLQKCSMSNDNSPSNVKRRNVVAARGFSEYSGSAASSKNCGKSELFACVENTKCSDAYKHVEAMPVVPLRHLPTLNVQLNCESLVARQDESDGDGQKLRNDNENEVSLENDTWESDLDILSARMAEAREYIDMFNAKYAALGKVPSIDSKGFDRTKSSNSSLLHDSSRTGEVKTLVETSQQKKTAANQNRSYSRNMIIVEDRVFKACERKKPSRSEVKLDDNEEICVLSPEEWNILQLHCKRRCYDDNTMVESQSIETIGCELSETNFVETPTVPYPYPQSIKTRAALKLFEEQYNELAKESREEGVGKCTHPHVTPKKQLKGKEVCIVDDISQGKENLPIRVMNGVDNDRYPSFTYVTNILYPTWFQRVVPIGCDCTDGCLDSQQCHCVLKNRGEIPFNEKGKIIKARPIVHECGSSCKCPPSCMNRVTQHGPRYQLEIFKTTTRGWGVRSKHRISSGSFICEYVGELLQDKEAEQRINDDEYLFDISDDREEDASGEFQGFSGFKSNDDSFAIDAAKFGNVGRFINHSCSPNLYAQKVLYDHDDKRMPHIMLFTTRKIPPLQELTYDYNYKIDRVCDASGNVKTKACYCGSRKCTGRMY